MIDIAGFLIIDKPSRITSHDVVDLVRKKLNIRKVGHAGTLDPLATGVMVIAVGMATRLLEYCVGHRKVYVADIEFGKRSDTYDIDGSINYEPCLPAGRLSITNYELYKNLISMKKVEEVCSKFKGKIKQIPPVYSAKKIKGVRAMDMVREGKSPKMKEVEIEVFSLDILSYEFPVLQIRLEVSSGTYIRSIANDLGDVLKCGGIITNLRRESSGNFSLKDAISVQDVSVEKLLPLEVAVSDMSRWEFNSEDIVKIKMGQKLLVPDGFPGGKVAVFSNGELISVVQANDGFVCICKNFVD